MGSLNPRTSAVFAVLFGLIGLESTGATVGTLGHIVVAVGGAAIMVGGLRLLQRAAHAAGEPIEAIAERETIAVPNDLLPRRGSAFVLRVRGESMIDEHIEDGDYVVVHNRNTADNGQMVVALIQGTSATVKRLYRDADGWIRLQPANERMQPIRVHEDDVLIQGVVVGVIRKY